MSEAARRVSLLDHALPPEGMFGHAGWVCGFSADAEFMDAFAARFTGLGRRQRSDLGRTFLCLCLDSSQPQIVPGEAPGVLHLPALSDKPPYRLMHAKVALLGFRSRNDASDWVLRLLVTTGNWTRQTTEDSIDLIWRLDISASEVAQRHPDDDVLRSRADFAAARDFWIWLRTHYQDGLFGAAGASGRPGETQRHPFSELDRWLRVVKAPRRMTPRFFDTRKQSILSQLAKRVELIAGPQRRNDLVLGSGFWEGNSEGKLPAVPLAIIEQLRKESLLSKTARISVVFESDQCAALADPSTFGRMEDEGWSLLHPAKAEGDTRRLHAKFLFSANYREASDTCLSAWVYLGSGNLTPAGFVKRPSRLGGNLEAGVIMVVEKVCWEGPASAELTPLQQFLPIDWDLTVTDASSLTRGDGPPERETCFLAVPVSHLLWTSRDGGGLLNVPEMQDVSGLEIIGPMGTALSQDDTRGFRWDGEQPVHVGVRSISSAGPQTATVRRVPVLDAYGRLAGRVLEPIDMEEAIELLSRFPLTVDLDDTPDGGNETSADDRRTGDRLGNSMEDTRYVVRRAMQLVEAIAERQTAVLSTDWVSWTQRLECVLTQLGSLPGQREGDGIRVGGDRKSAFVEALLPFQINVLDCLILSPFLPDHVRPDGTAIQALQETIRAVEVNWGMSGFPGLEGRARNAA